MVMWYYSRDRKTRLGPVSEEQLRELIAARQVESADMVWREGFQTWLPVAQVPGLTPPPAPPRPQVPVAVLPPHAPPATLQPSTVPVQILQPTGPLKAELLPDDHALPSAPHTAALAPVSVASAAPIAVVPVALAAAPSALGELFKKSAAAPTPQPPAPAPIPLAAERPQPDVAPQQPSELSPRVVGCPRCQSKLRAKRPGVIQCPKCQAKVRVADALFSRG